ncbi:hypothetical protein F5890DRAFT_1501268 [Lentinula detonsa]|uniref:RING-type domain-containing protein n=1 Tax=Lentinula detonsa TaxID=2804962 RepID=A0AA38UWE9_9AGAR|nr:hypothetical protein F5890DRAFT_1501268 [Lentinula detonsa]
MNHLESIHDFIEALPYIDKHSVPEGVCCPICLVSFEDILEDASAEKPLGGVTMLPSCQHTFCRNDLIEWIQGMHGSCPSCRHVFLDIRPPSDSDSESSDGGEYFPNEEEEEDPYMSDTDDFTEMDEFDFEMEEVDLDMYQNWEPSDIGDEIEDVSLEWGLTDGESFSNSDEEVSLESDPASLLQRDGNIVIRGDVDENLDVDSLNDEEK